MPWGRPECLIDQSLSGGDQALIIENPAGFGPGTRVRLTQRGQARAFGVVDRVLHGVSFRARAGETIAIVGRSGSGKSTVVNLLPRFYDASAGAVLLDGQDVRDYPLERLRAQMSLVSQDVVLFNDTIRSKIAFGYPATDAEIEAASEAARVLEFAAQMPLGLDTVVGDRGALLSGGQPPSWR